VTLPPGRARLVTKPIRNRIGRNSEDNGNSLGRLLGGPSGGCDWATMTSTLSATVRPQERGAGRPSPRLSVFDHEVAALDVTEITQSLTEGLDQVGSSPRLGVT
jgi:hypothetical protein